VYNGFVEILGNSGRFFFFVTRLNIDFLYSITIGTTHITAPTNPYIMYIFSSVNHVLIFFPEVAILSCVELAKGSAETLAVGAVETFAAGTAETLAAGTAETFPVGRPYAVAVGLNVCVKLFVPVVCALVAIALPSELMLKKTVALVDAVGIDTILTKVGPAELV
jgi:hypothetical protein